MSRHTLHEDRLQRFSRLFVIYNTLAMGHQVNADDLAAACHCHRKTILRDLPFLREAGAEYRWDAKRRSYVLEAPLPQLRIELTLPEILALALWREALPTDSGLPYAPQARSAFQKLATHLPLTLREELETLRPLLSFQSETRHHYASHQQGTLQTVIEATRAQQTIEITYYTISRDEYSMRQINPYALALQGGYLNVVAYCLQRRAVRLFALDNILAVQATGAIFERQPRFSLAEFLQGSVGMLRGRPIDIVVRFEKKIARWARRYKWNFQPILEEQADGSLVMRAQVSGLDGIRTELLRWGSPVTVLEPPELQDALLKEAQALVEKYEKMSRHKA